jgi:cytochrome c heme-lyase
MPPEAHSSSDVAYNVYNQPLDPSNQMPVTPNQLPWPGQHKPLSTERAVSTIPKGGTAGRATWVFPSPQMFYNALQRKGKGDDVVEEDMEHVITVHNGVRLWGRMHWLARWLTHALPLCAPHADLARSAAAGTSGMNEMTWQQVLRWEHLHRSECAQPSLLRFFGRPDDLSPRARWKMLLGGAWSSSHIATRLLATPEADTLWAHRAGAV